ncbi:MAG: class I SAM-dependent methyltransferase, partial [Polymorphobacter sp.]
MSLRHRFDDFVARAQWHFHLRLSENVRRNLTYETVWRLAAEDSARFITDNLGAAVLYQHRNDFWAYMLRNLPTTGLVLEVGVFQGKSINMIADFCTSRGDDRTIHGFDSFEGLEEDWAGEGLREGFFDQGGKLPAVRANVRLHKGWVKDTMAPFLAAETAPQIGLLHIDTDTYTPARHILEIAAPHLVAGSIIVFDELIGYPNWRAHEYK